MATANHAEEVSRRFLSADERGSVISVTDSAGALLGLNRAACPERRRRRRRRDEFGQPQSTNIGAFGYTGQAWLPGASLWHYKARAYEPELGRFLQPDPIGVEGGVNLYAYVGNDPVNLVDPLGLKQCTAYNPDIEGPTWSPCPTYGPTYYEFAAGFFREQLRNIRDLVRPIGPRRPEGGASPRSPQPKANSEAPTKKTCIALADGPVVVTGGGFSFTLGVGGSSVAHFSIPSTGASGWVTTGGGHVGLEGFAGAFAGRYESMGDLLGMGWQFTLEVPVPGAGFGVYGSRLNSPVTGGFGSWGAGGGMSLGRVGTRLKSSSIPLCK